MSEKLIVKTMSKKLVYEIQNDGVNVSYSKWFRGIHTYYEYKIHFEDIGTGFTYKRGKKFVSYLFLIFSGLSFIGLISSILGLDDMEGRGFFVFIPSAIFWLILAYLAFRDENLTMIYMNTRKEGLFFIETKRNKEEVEKFIDLIYLKAKECIKQKYSILDEDLPYDFQLNNVELLRQNGVITEYEYNQIIAKLEKKDKKVGFQIFTNKIDE